MERKWKGKLNELLVLKKIASKRESEHARRKSLYKEAQANACRASVAQTRKMEMRHSAR